MYVYQYGQKCGYTGAYLNTALKVMERIKGSILHTGL